LELVGIVGGSFIGFLFPGLVILRVKGFNHLKEQISKTKGFYNKILSILELILPIFIIIFGILIFILGIASLIFIA